MEAIFIIMFLGLVGGGTSEYFRRKREKKEYEEYMARRITFDVSELNSEK